MAEPRLHLPEIDRLKGFAILSVICIHAKVYSHTLLFDRITNRAVPIFLVLFGITSELYLERLEGRGISELGKKWYWGRFRRLLVPYWAMTTAWWLAAEHWGYARYMRLGLREAAATFAGYAPWIGTSWFVTVILQVVLFLPAYRWLAIRAGAIVSLLFAAAVTSASAFYLWNIVEAGKAIFGEDAPEPGWYYQWIFSPRVLWHVTAGIFVARIFRGSVPGWLTVTALATTVAGSYLTDLARGPPQDIFVGSLRQQAVAYLVDVPLTIGLLGAFRFVPLPSLVQRSLAWCGVWSWGLYLGHLLIHELLHMKNLDPEHLPQSLRIIYAVFLLVSGITLARVTERVGRLLGISDGKPGAPSEKPA